MKRNGQVLAVTPRERSRRELLVTTQEYGQTRVTLAAGVLGTPEGLEVVDRASDLERSAAIELRRSARDDRRR